MFTPDHHITIAASWDSDAAKDFIRHLFLDAEAVFKARAFWPVHPDDGEPPGCGYFPSLYEGTAGIAWAQLALAARGYGELQNNYSDSIKTARIDAVTDLNNAIEFDNPRNYLHGLLVGELGFSAPMLKLNPDQQALDTAIRLISENLHNKVLELLWGSPGSMLLLAALIESGRISQDHSHLLVTGADFLKEQLVESPSRHCRLWRQNLYGNRTCYLGAAHGFAGNSLAIIRSLEYLTDSEQVFWKALIRDTTKRTATFQSGEANWALTIDSGETDRPSLLQFCHGAPGMIICLASLMGEVTEFDNLMLAAGGLVFKAGPLSKGSNFCHGTSGNGWALLKLFEATGDEMWLDRAKQFAAAAIVQSEQDKVSQGCYHHSLWTGDQGTALFADACMTVDFAVPTLEVF